MKKVETHWFSEPVRKSQFHFSFNLLPSRAHGAAIWRQVKRQQQSAGSWGRLACSPRLICISSPLGAQLNRTSSLTPAKLGILMSQEKKMQPIKDFKFFSCWCLFTSKPLSEQLPHLHRAGGHPLILRVSGVALHSGGRGGQH